MPWRRAIDAHPIRIDEVHEFFPIPQKVCNEAARAWERWFMERGIRYERRDFMGKRFQLYVHRCRNNNGRGQGRFIENSDVWCCGIVARAS